jgi:hypothetical protein
MNRWAIVGTFLRDAIRARNVLSIIVFTYRPLFRYAPPRQLWAEWTAQVPINMQVEHLVQVSVLQRNVVPGDCQLVRAATKSQSVGGRVCGSKGLARTRLTALHDSSEPPRVRLRARESFRRQPRFPRSARWWPQSADRPQPHEPRGLSSPAAGHTPTKTESVRNPAPPGVQKVLDRRRRFTLNRLRSLLHDSTNVAASRRMRQGCDVESFGCGDTRSVSLAKRVNCTPRDDRGTKVVNHFSRLPAG